MPVTATLIVLAVSAAAAVFFAWRGAQPPDLVRGPRMLPYRLLMVLSASVALFMMLHLMNLAGFVTGPR